MISFPYNANIEGYDAEGMPMFDRSIDAETQRKWTSLFYTNGVLADDGGKYNFRVIGTGEGMSVIVSAGACHINGVIGFEESERELLFQASEKLDRIDRIVLRLNDATRVLDLYVKKGVAATLPVAPALTRPVGENGGDIYEIGIADVFITKNSTSIAASRITDTRLNQELCGIITNAIDNLNTNSYFKRFEEELAEKETEFTKWFETVQGVLGQDEAGKLLNMIHKINRQWVMEVPSYGWEEVGNDVYVQPIEEVNSKLYEKIPMFDILLNVNDLGLLEAQLEAYSYIATILYDEGSCVVIAVGGKPEIDLQIITTEL